MENTIQSIHIFGLGLIGGSMAKAFKAAHPHVRVGAMDQSAEALLAAREQGAIDEAIAPGAYEKLAQADIVVLCAPAEAALAAMEKVAPHVKPGAVVTDACSIKGPVAEKARALMGEHPQFVFVGGHPMAGSEKSGYGAASPHLFENAVYLLMPLGEGDRHKHALLKMEQFVKGIRGLAHKIRVEEHDGAVAMISHLPHLAASALAGAAMERDGNGLLRMLAAGGFRDTTRIASGDPELWRGIMMGNRGALLEGIEVYVSQIRNFQRALLEENGEALYRLLSDAKAYREGIRQKPPGYAAAAYELTVDVPDKPGIVAGISTRLFEAGINLRDIYIAHSRELEAGCMRLTFTEAEERNRAMALLLKAGYPAYTDTRLT